MRRINDTQCQAIISYWTSWGVFSSGSNTDFHQRPLTATYGGCIYHNHENRGSNPSGPSDLLTIVATTLLIITKLMIILLSFTLLIRMFTVIQVRKISIINKCVNVLSTGTFYVENLEINSFQLGKNIFFSDFKFYLISYKVWLIQFINSCDQESLLNAGSNNYHWLT